MTHAFNLEMYTNFLIANGNRYSGVEASKALTLTHGSEAPAHDTISRWLASETSTSNDLWMHIKNLVDTKRSNLIVDDTVLDKQWSPNNELVRYHWSGNEHSVIRGISLVNLLATTGKDCIPIDYRIYEGKESKMTKNDHFLAMLDTAKERGFKPRYVLADAWYGSVMNLKKIRSLGWKFIIGMKENRIVNVTQGTNISVADLDWKNKRLHKVWLRDFGFVLVARIIFKNGDTRYIATNDLSLTRYDDLSAESKQRWTIEEFHRGIKQTTGIERCYSIKKRSQLTHIFSCFIAFLRLEFERIRSGVSWYEQKARMVRKGMAGAFA